MVAINQRIPNFLGGVSQQPDTIKFPGQVRTCDNFVPDVTFGLQKRPSGKFVGKLANANNTGYWYEILRDGDEKYLVQITPANSGSMPIRVWDLADGTEKSLTNSSGDSIFSYLAQTGTTEKYAIQTIQDYTLIANPKVTAKRNNTLVGGLLDNGDYSFVRLDTIAYNTEYVLYTGQPVTPNTYYRVTALSVTKTSGSPSGNTETGNTWDSVHKDGRYSGLAQFAFTDSECENIEGHVTVNAANYVDSNQANYQADDASGTPGTSGTGADFIGYTQVYKTRYTAQVTLKDGGLIKNTTESNALAKSQSVTIEGVTYTINVDAVEPVETYEGVSGIAFYKTPRNPDEGSLSMSKILKGLKDGLSNISDCNGTIIGSGMYLYGLNAPKINFLGGAVNEQMSVIGRTVDDISRLPAQCKNGYVVQVSNTDNSDADNYYVKFITDTADQFQGDEGPGRWEECPRPDLFDSVTTGGYYNGISTSSSTFNYVLASHGLSVGDERWFEFTTGSLSNSDGLYACISVTNSGEAVFELGFNSPGSTIGNITAHANPELTGFDASTMPHALVNNRDNTFTFKKLDQTTDADNYWKTREVGDVTTNPFPSIQDKKIQKIFFHRNRLGLIADEQVLLSRPGDYFNLFVVSAITTSDDNPIDITVSDIKPAFINHTLPVQKGVMMFSDNGQFLLFTESDIFSPKTARLKKISSYETDADIQPLDMGTSIMFTSKLSAHTRAFEATVLDDDIPPKILEQTRVVPEFVPKDITMSTNSANLGMVTFARTNSKTLYHYKYYDSGERRDQSAWYTWTLTHFMHHMFYTEGCLYTVIKQMDDYMLNRYEFVADHESILQDINVGEDGLARKLPVCLDNAIGVGQGNMSYSESTGKTTVTLPYTPSNLNEGLPYIVLTSGNITSVPSDGTGNHAAAGLVIQAESVSTDTAVFNEKLTGNFVYGLVGYKYTSTLELPTYYPVLGENQFDINGDLRISGMNFELGVASPMEFHLESIYSDIDDYIHEYTAIEADTEDTFGSNPVKVQQSIRVPIQRKNKKYNLTLKSIEAFPMSLISASWDGIYNQRRHVRR